MAYDIEDDNLVLHMTLSGGRVGIITSKNEEPITKPELNDFCDLIISDFDGGAIAIKLRSDELLALAYGIVTTIGEEK